LLSDVTHVLFYLRLNLSGDNSASGSPHLSRLEEKAAAVNADDLMNIGLVIDFVRRDDPPVENLALDSDSGKKPFRRKKGDFMFMPR
jgi:hypothetical protein